MERAHATRAVAAGAGSDDLTPAALAVRVLPHRIAAERALAFAHPPGRQPAAEVALQEPEDGGRRRDTDHRENQQAEVERIEVVRQVVDREDEGQDRANITAAKPSGR